jgi:hypothetical protein
MGQEQLMDTDGPGCMKCGMHWNNPEDGYGALCQVDDRDWESGLAAQMEARQQMTSMNMDKVIASVRESK